ncbi:MAG: aspartate carbamoyltransferase [Nitrosomonas sp.]|uniref:aspartate carbamoyltransferase n=1 Tax=Nitrosomonas sp. TaxID=42353 RepID=UPI002731EEDE|nr:aspartate carbamoyltransferase [Nitrosomonas sp.]MDP1549060.1 aspartate carbamoyltransferase [Nitrosomonas sp.]
MMRLLFVVFGLTLLTILPVYAVEKADEDRLDEVAERGAHVMPFDLEKTTHVFSKTDTGGIQQVIANDKSDTKQISLIRSHLSGITDEFKQGNFSNPEKIHGASMPGLAELKTAKTGQIKIEYKELPDGAEITYSTHIEKLKLAIHQWFDAQLSDHARHAVSGHSHQHMHHKD